MHKHARARARGHKKHQDEHGPSAGARHARGTRGAMPQDFFEEEEEIPRPRKGGKGKGGKDTRLYELLGVQPDASEVDIKRAYRALVMQLHPDKNPDPAAHEKCKELTAAYEILRNPETRAKYDKYGENFMKEGGMGEDMFPGGRFPDIFRDIFGGGGGGGDDDDEEEEEKVEEIREALTATLEELYAGATKPVRVARNALCATCSGSGTKPGKQRVHCRHCDGQGVQVVVQQMFVFMQEVQVPCQRCNGQGGIIRPADRCAGCDGNRIVPQEAMVNVPIPAGASHGEKIRVPHQGHADPDLPEQGDVVVMLQQAEHPVFKRNGMDLLVKRTISLMEALCGVSFPLHHLDGRVLLIKTVPGEVVKSGDVRAVPNEGMPDRRNAHLKGQLLVLFDVELPTSISPEVIAALQKVMPMPKSEPVPMDAEECFLHQHAHGAAGFRDDREGPRRGGGHGHGHGHGGHGHGHSDDDDEFEDDDGDAPPGGAQCVHM